MATIYLTEQNTTLRKEANRFVIERDEQKLAEIHEFKVERVVVFGNVQLTTATIAYLLERGIDTAFLSTHGKLKGRLEPLATKNVSLRLRQYQRAADLAFTTAMARAFIAGKIANCQVMLARQQRNHTECQLHDEIGQLSKLKQRLPQVSSRETLRGIEGQAAAVYFDGFAKTLRRGVSFNKRTRRPPTDPVNALLSFGYTLLYNEAISALTVIGCDPYLGFYHTAHFGRCSLALDLMEEFRALVADRLALNLINLNIITPDDFIEVEQGGQHLSDAARKRFLREYERLVNAEFLAQPENSKMTLRRALYEQALVVRRAVMRGQPYQPFQGWR